MNVLIFLIVAVLIVYAIKTARTNTQGGSTKRSGQTPTSSTQPQRYFYSKKESLMTPAEESFYHRLQNIAGSKYYIFPQIHLSALLNNETKGRYWKAAFQRINRMSVDYVLADKSTLKAVYAIELDDRSHDNPKRRARDEGVNKILGDAGIRLVRFRDVAQMTDEEIIEKFKNSFNMN